MYNWHIRNELIAKLQGLIRHAQDSLFFNYYAYLHYLKRLTHTPLHRELRLFYRSKFGSPLGAGDLIRNWKISLLCVFSLCSVIRAALAHSS